MKSHVSVLLELAACVITDAAAKCTTNQLEYRDIRTICSRVKHEGMSFLTITLPTFGKDFEKSLALGRIEPTFFRSFKKNGVVPAFLQGFTALVFDTSTGGIVNEPSVAAIEGIRQIAYTFKKLKLPCTPLRIAKAYERFKDDEQDLKEPLEPTRVRDYRRVCDCLWGSVFGHRFYDFHTLIPRHGPGSTAERLLGNEKYAIKRWHDRLEPYFPLLSTAFSSENAWQSEEFENVSIVHEDSEQPVRVITVPKTLTAPRIIAIEPVCMQYTQQALARYIIKSLDTAWLTTGHINFSDQETNRRLAIYASKTGKLATVDLSSASDRVPLSLAAHMFDSRPELRDAILACRSKRAQINRGQVIDLHKFASMGSALCFPVESMYFYTLCVMALLVKHNLSVTQRNIYLVSRWIFVYGDDLIIPVDGVDEIIDNLQKYYCKVNTTKSFWTGKFRESCGMDAYNGEEVTPTYVRTTPPNDLRSSGEVMSWISTSNLFYKKGYWLTSQCLLKRCESITGTLPVVGHNCSGLGIHSYQRNASIGRWGLRYQRPEVKTWVAVPKRSKDPLTGYGALTKCLLGMENRLLDEPLSEEGHLARSVRPGAVVLKRQWVQPY